MKKNQYTSDRKGQFPDFKILITCCNKNGGLFQLQFIKNKAKLIKISDEGYRGIAKYNNHLILISNNKITMLDSDYNVVNKSLKKELGYHGVSIYKNKAYIVESQRNSIGIYSLPNLKRVDEIIISSAKEDVNHVNDLFIVNDKIYISMFATARPWRQSSIQSGSIVEYCLKKRQIIKVHYHSLSQPHSVSIYNGNMYYCNSAEFEVKRNKATIFKNCGYLRGLAIRNTTMFIGQSETRHLNNVIDGKTNVSLDCGIYIFDSVHKVSRFVKLPAKEVYGIIVL
jgi:hypothetical protein